MLFGTIPIQNVTRQMINSEVTTLTKYSQSVISKVWQQMNGAYEEAKLRRIVNENPFELKNYIIKPKSSIPTKVIDSLTIEEEKRFIAELEKGYDEYTIVFFISIYTGMRISEILALERKDIDFNNRIIHVRKTLSHIDNGKVIIENTTKTFAGMRDIPILSVLYEKLLKYQIDKKTGYLFQNNGEFIHYTCLNTRFKKLCKYICLDFYF